MRVCRALFMLLLAAPAALADDWPQWMGPGRDGVWKEAGILDKFPEGGPKRLWSAKVHGGYAGPAVVGGKVYVTDWVIGEGAKPAKGAFDVESRVPGTERVLCLSAEDGTQLWEHKYPCAYQLSYGNGPRCTPTVNGGKVYTLGAMGDLVCLSADKGEPLWKKDFKADYKAKVPLWGFAGHPLVYENLLICLVGGENALVVAFDKDSGKEVWKALSPHKPGASGYSSPKLIQAGGTTQVAQFHPTGVTGLDPKSGKELWTVKLEPPAQDDMSIMTPQQSGDTLFVAARGGGAVAVRLDPAKPAAEVAWRGDPKKTALYPINMTPLLEGDTIYGVDMLGMLRAVDLKTGKRLWFTFEPVLGREHDEDYNGGGTGTAFVVRNGDRYFLFNETGGLVIARMTREKYTQLDAAHLIEPTSAGMGRKVVWSHPAFADRKVFVRNDQEVRCFSLAKE